ncbi:hypothetical protein N0V95_010026, partial [Ascochyta clinopodiicola]
MWTTKSFNYLNDIRKSWCTELAANMLQEAINYIQGIASQWREITLQWNDTVVQSIDPESITMLQSLAPRLSNSDRDYVVSTFERRQMLPRLTDKKLRDAVKAAVCRQGPILTLATFAEDVRLLLSRVHKALTPVLGGMRRARHDTLRKRVKMILEKEFDLLSQAEKLPIASTVQKEMFLDRCYQHVFLHAIRAAHPKGVVSTTQLKNLVRQEMDSQPRMEGVANMHTPEDVEDEIAVKAPAAASPSYPTREDTDMSKGHGVQLFKRATAGSLLYYDLIHTRHPPGLSFSQSSMAKHIVRMFLFGRGTEFETGALSLGSPTVSLDPINAMLKSLPFRSRAPDSVCTVDDRESVSGVSSQAASESELDAASVLWRRPHIQTASVRSQAGSIVDQGTPA